MSEYPSYVDPNEENIFGLEKARVEYLNEGSDERFGPLDAFWEAATGNIRPAHKNKAKPSLVEDAAFAADFFGRMNDLPLTRLSLSATCELVNANPNRAANILSKIKDLPLPRFALTLLKELQNLGVGYETYIRIADETFGDSQEPLTIIPD